MNGRQMSRLGLVVVHLVLTCMFLYRSDAQTRQGIQIPDLNLLRPDLKMDAVPSSVGKTIVPMDAPVDPAEYRVGPGDVLALNVWSSAPKEYTLTVTPEGTLLIPLVGSVDLRDITLAAAKERVTEKLKRYYANSETSLTLLTPRKVVVQVIGNVVNEGPYEMYSVQRVDQLINQGNKPQGGQSTSREFEDAVGSARRTAGIRTITLRRRNGVTEHVDLVKYERTGLGRFNPYLSEGDVVFVPERPPLAKSIGIFGGVTRSWTFDFIGGDSLTHLVQMGFGLKPLADTSGAYLTRLTPDGSTMESTWVDLRGIIAGTTPDIALRPGDRLVINERRDDRLDYIVAIEGEVSNPGHYPITRDSTRLTDVIGAAGGFTRNAFLRGATIVRSPMKSVQTAEEIQNEQLRSARASLNLQDSSYYLTETALRIQGEIVAVDFHKLFVEGDSSQNVIVRPYDLIHIPLRTNTVYVFGQVRAPGHLALVEGEGVSYYLDRAGGVTNEGRKSDVMVIKSGTRAWLAPGETRIEDGDFIWVPREVHYPFGHYLAIIAQAAIIISATVTVAYLFKKN